MPPKRGSSADLLHSERTAVSAHGSSLSGAAVDNIRRKVLEQAYATLDCRKIVDAVLLDVDDEIVRMHMDHMAVPWTVQSVLTDLFESIEVAFAEREDVLDADAAWDDESFADVVETLEEPDPIPSDPWCRGIMNKRRPVPLPQTTAPTTAAAGGAPTLSSSQGLSRSFSAASPTAIAAASAAASGGRHGAGGGKSRDSAVKPVAPVLNGSLNELILLERPQSAASSVQRSVSGFRGPMLNMAKAGGASRPQSKASGRSSAAAGAVGDRLDSHRSDSEASQATGIHNNSSPTKASRSGHRSKRDAKHGTTPGSPSAGGSTAQQSLTAALGGNRTPQGTKFTDEELAILKKHKETSQRMQQLRRIADKVDHQLSDVKANNPFVVDGATHSVIAIQTIDPLALPARQDPKVVVDRETTTKASRAAAAAAAAAASGLASPDLSTIRSHTPGGNKSRGGVQSPTATANNVTAQLQSMAANQRQQRVDITLFYTQEAQVQPMIQAIAPAAGVATKDGEQVRRNELKLPKSKMSRMEFSKLVQGQASGGGGGGGGDATTAGSNAAASGGKGGEGSGAEAPISPPLSSVRRQSLAPGAAGSKHRGPASAEAASMGTPPPPMAYIKQPNAAGHHDGEGGSVLDAPTRALTPQPTASRPKHIRHQSPSRENNKRADSAARSAAARTACSALVARATDNANRTIRTPKVHLAGTTQLEDETAKDFLNSLEMGDFEVLTFQEEDM